MSNQSSEESDFPNIGRPATGALALEGYTRLEQLTKISEKELLAIHGVGPKAIRILREALDAKGLSFAEPPKKAVKTKKSDSESDFPKLAAPAQRALAGAGYTSLEQLAKVSEDEIKNLHGIGPNVLKQLRAALEAKGLSFKKSAK